MTTDTHARDQAAAQLESIREMLAALNCDYDRLEALRNWRCAFELDDLEEAAGDCESQDDASQRIQEDPLSVQVRSGWYTPGEEAEAEEYEIVLCTGGPAVRIIGELDQYKQPSSARMQYQDWGTPWTDYHEDGVTDACLEYAQQFYFGE